MIRAAATAVVRMQKRDGSVNSIVVTVGGMAAAAPFLSCLFSVPRNVRIATSI